MKLSLSLITAFIAVSLAAQMPQPLLKDGDIDKFIETIKPVASEIRELGIEVSSMSIPFMDEIDGTLPIFKKYGWEPGFGKKWEAIICCQALADNYELSDLGKEPIMCDNLQLNPDDVKKVKLRSSEVLEAIIASMTGG